MQPIHNKKTWNNALSKHSQAISWGKSRKWCSVSCLEEKKVGLQARGSTLKPAVTHRCHWSSLSVRQYVCVWVCVCVRGHTACVRHKPVIPVGIRCFRVLRPWSWMSHSGFVPGALWVFPRSGCLLTKTYLESIKDLKMSDHQNVIALLPSFNWWSWGWRLRLHTSHRYHSPNLPGSRPLLMLTGLCGLSQAWLGFLLHHVWRTWLHSFDQETGPNALSCYNIGFWWGASEKIQMIKWFVAETDYFFS